MRCINPGNSRSRNKNSTVDGDLARSKPEAITAQDDDALQTCQSKDILIHSILTYLALAKIDYYRTISMLPIVCLAWDVC